MFVYYRPIEFIDLNVLLEVNSIKNNNYVAKEEDEVEYDPDSDVEYSEEEEEEVEEEQDGYSSEYESGKGETEEDKALRERQEKTQRILHQQRQQKKTKRRSMGDVKNSPGLGKLNVRDITSRSLFENNNNNNLFSLALVKSCQDFCQA